MKNSIPEGIKKLQAELERKEKYWRDWNGRAANRAAELEQRISELEAEIERLRKQVTGMQFGQVNLREDADG